MTKIKQSDTATHDHQKHCKTLIRRARDFMRVRQALVTSTDCLPAMIMACIAEGAQTRDDIVRNVPRFVGRSYAEVAAVLDSFAGSCPEHDYWYRDETKVYRLHIPTKRRRPPVQLNLGRIARKAARRGSRPSGHLDDQHF